MNIELLAQQYLPISPRHVSILRTDNNNNINNNNKDEDDPAVVLAVASAFDSENRLFFMEWNDARDASSFCLTNVSVPGKYISSLTLILSPEGVIHCVVQSNSGKENITYVYRRTVLESDNNNDDDDLFNNSNSNSNNNNRVKYRKLPKEIKDNYSSWTAATRLYRNNMKGKMAVACQGNDIIPSAIQIHSLTGTRLSLQQTIELPMLSTFPILQLREIDGDAASLLALCHHAVLEIDPRLKSHESIVRAWRWSPHDPLTAFTVKDNYIIGGSEDGVVIVWDLRFSSVRGKGSVAVDHSLSCGAAVTGIHMPYSTNIFSCHSDGSVLAWDWRGVNNNNNNNLYNVINSSSIGENEERGGGFRFVSRSINTLPPVFVGTPGCVGIAAEDDIAVVADESGTLSIFEMS